MKFLFCHHLSFKSYTIRRQFKHFSFNAHSLIFTVKYQGKSLMSDWFNSSRRKIKLGFCTSYEYHSPSFLDTGRLRDIWFNVKMISKDFLLRRRNWGGAEWSRGNDWETRKIYEWTAWKGIILEEILKRTIIIRFMFCVSFLLISLGIASIEWFIQKCMLNITD